MAEIFRIDAEDLGAELRTRAEHQIGAEQRVIPFPGPAHSRAKNRPGRALREWHRFEQSGEPDDYPHRMRANFAAGIVLLLLIFSGLWIADSLAKMQKDQDCVLIGRRDCAKLDLPPGSRY